MDARDLFISHSSADADAARALRAELETAGYSCWMAPDDVVGTETWAEQILGAIDRCRAMVVLVSTNANRSPHVSREVNLALARKRAVLPIRIEAAVPEGSLEYLLSLVQRVDAFPPPITDHRDRIVRRLDAVLRPNATPPPPPQRGEAALPGEAQPGEAQRPEPATPTARRAAIPIGPGSLIDDFTIEALLGEGGMGAVYRARQAEPNRAVALKVIRPDHAADETYRRRFLAEKDTLATLEHPSIVPIYAAGDEAGVLYIAMRLVDGSDLHARIAADGQLSLRDTLRILRPIADAIDYAHGMGVIHRDLKPSNIILDRHGRPYLTDFGLGKRVERPSQMTQPGVALGTLDYMAPEQFTGRIEPATANRIDVYALGCIVYACLTGRPPFVRDAPEQLMYAHTHEPPPGASTARPELSPAVDDVLLKALAKNPVDRFSSATELIEALDEAALATARAPEAVSSPAAAAPPPPPAAITPPPPPAAVPLPPPAAVPPPPPAATPVPSGPVAWLRANRPLAVTGAAIAVVGVVVLTALGSGNGPGPSASPAGSPSTATSGPTAASTLDRQLAPLDFAALELGPTTVDLSWRIDPAQAPESYNLYRDDVFLASLPGDGPTFVLDAVQPSTSYRYGLEIVGGLGTSALVEATIATAPAPPLGDAWLGLPWHVDLTYVSTNFNGRSDGEQDTERWTVTPDCEFGACEATLAGVHEQGEEGRLTPAAEGYTGTLTYAWTDERCGDNSYLGTLELAVARAGFAWDGTWIAEALDGTLDEGVESTNCNDGFADIELALRLPGDPDDDLRPALDEALAGCTAGEASAGWPTALTQLRCTAGSEVTPVTFYLFGSASSARDALAEFLDFRVISGASSCSEAGSQTGYGPHFGDGFALGDVACGPAAGAGEASPGRIYVWSYLPAAIVGYANWDDGAALGDWWSDHRNWLGTAFE